MLITLKNIACINLILHIIQTLVIAVCNDSLTRFLELLQIINHNAAKEFLSIFQSRLINDDSCAFGFDALHDTLNGTLAEVITVTLHRQPVNTNNNFFLLAFVPAVICFISTSNLQHTVGNEVLASPWCLSAGNIRHNRRTDYYNVFQYVDQDIHH